MFLTNRTLFAYLSLVTDFYRFHIEALLLRFLASKTNLEQCEPNTRPTFGWKANVQMIHFGWFQRRSHASAHQFVSYGSVTLTLRKWCPHGESNPALKIENLLS